MFLLKNTHIGTFALISSIFSLLWMAFTSVYEGFLDYEYLYEGTVETSHKIKICFFLYIAATLIQIITIPYAISAIANNRQRSFALTALLLITIGLLLSIKFGWLRLY